MIAWNLVFLLLLLLLLPPRNGPGHGQGISNTHTRAFTHRHTHTQRGRERDHETHLLCCRAFSVNIDLHLPLFLQEMIRRSESAQQSGAACNHGAGMCINTGSQQKLNSQRRFPHWHGAARHPMTASLSQRA